MPDLFVGGAAGPPGRPDWVNNAFPDPVKNDPVYLAAALVELSSLFFQDSVLPELRPLPTDPYRHMARTRREGCMVALGKELNLEHRILRDTTARVEAFAASVFALCATANANRRPNKKSRSALRDRSAATSRSPAAEGEQLLGTPTAPITFIPFWDPTREHAVSGFSRRGADDYDTTSPPTHRELTAPRENY